MKKRVAADTVLLKMPATPVNWKFGDIIFKASYFQMVLAESEMNRLFTCEGAVGMRDFFDLLEKQGVKIEKDPFAGTTEPGWSMSCTDDGYWDEFWINFSHFYDGEHFHLTANHPPCDGWKQCSCWDE